MPAAPHVRAVVTAITSCLALSGCWKDELAQLPADAVAFTPAMEAPEGWKVTPLQLALDCPDGERARFHLLHPSAPPARPTAAAILFHSGAFDFIFNPVAADPLAGTHYASPGRLDAAWATRHVFATLGMLPTEIEGEDHLGGLAVAFAEREVPVLLPANCWGDLWHNRRALAQNDFEADLFARDGRTAAEWALELLADPDFAALQGVDLPIEADPERIYLAGLGEGGRAVGELLSLAQAEGAPPVAGALVDSHASDLSVHFDDPSRFDHKITGLNRIFPGGAEEADATSLHRAALPPRFGYLYASGDPQIPLESHDALAERLADLPDTWLHVDDSARHILLDGHDMDLAREAVGWLLD